MNTRTITARSVGLSLSLLLAMDACQESPVSPASIVSPIPPVTPAAPSLPGAPPPADLVFTRLSDGQIYKLSTENVLTQLTNNSNWNTSPKWSPDGKRIAYSMFPRETSHGVIYTMDPDGSNVVQLTTSGNFASASWSPNSRKLLISDEGTYEGSVWMIDVDKPNAEPVFLAYDARDPVWSPDGKEIAYIHLSHDDGYNQIYLMDSDGTNIHAITENDSGWLSGLSWSPDGQRLAVSKCLFGSCGIYIVDATNGQFDFVTAVASPAGADWSPDGKWIAFTSGRYTSRGEWIAAIGYVPIQGGTKFEIPDGEGPSWRR